jgi:hypothetical protein
MHDFIALLKSTPYKNWQRTVLTTFLACYILCFLLFITQRSDWYYSGFNTTVCYIWVGLVSSLLLIPQGKMKHLMQQLTQLNWRYWLVFLLCCFVFANLSGPIRLIRHFIFFLPMGIAFILYLPASIASYKKAKYELKIGVVLTNFLLLALIIPGFIFPPVYAGIAGWATKKQFDDKIFIRHVRIVNKSGDWQWLSGEITSPVYIKYQVSAAEFLDTPGNNIFFPTQSPIEKNISELFSYYKNIYEYHYPYLQKNIYPNEKYLGKYALMSHHPAQKFDYSKFPPDDLAAIEYVGISYDLDGNIIEEDIYYSYPISQEVRWYNE